MIESCVCWYYYMTRMHITLIMFSTTHTHVRFSTMIPQGHKISKTVTNSDVG